MNLLRLLSLVIVVSVLSGCTSIGNFFDGKDDKEPLEGKRISVLDLQRDLEPGDMTLDAQGFVAPTAWKNEFWPQTGGYPNHSMQHVNLNSGELALAWKTKIGKGSSKHKPLTAQPVVVDKRVFTLDSNATLSAFSTEDGKRLWEIDVQYEDEDDVVIGGGISYSRGVLYVTNGFREILAVDPVEGKIIWRSTIPAPSRAAPTIMDGRIFVVTLDNRLLALNLDDGAVQWEFSGISETAGLVGAASPAVSREIVIPAFSSGEIFALRVENGSIAWADNLSSLRRSGGLASLSDIKALPVIDKGLVIAISFGGRLVAIDARTGGRVWSREIGGSETPWVSGNHVFVISSKNELIALGRDNGAIRWVSELPRYKKKGDPTSDKIFWVGPILAGGRLITASSNGLVYEINPEDGAMIRQWETDRNVRTAPIVADNMLYLLGEDATLMAYR